MHEFEVAYAKNSGMINIKIGAHDTVEMDDSLDFRSQNVHYISIGDPSFM